jgi:hypothetical protein
LKGSACNFFVAILETGTRRAHGSTPTWTLRTLFRPQPPRCLLTKCFNFLGTRRALGSTPTRTSSTLLRRPLPRCLLTKCNFFC